MEGFRPRIGAGPRPAGRRGSFGRGNRHAGGGPWHRPDRRQPRRAPGSWGRCSGPSPRGGTWSAKAATRAPLSFPRRSVSFFCLPRRRSRRTAGRPGVAARGQTVELAALLHALEERNRRDATRNLAPMIPAANAVVLDSTGLSMDEVVDRMEAEVRRRPDGATPEGRNR